MKSNDKLIILYDNWCPNCKRFTKIVKIFDWFSLIRCLPLRNGYQDITLDKDRAFKQMASKTKGKWRYGFSTIYRVIFRLPLFWTVLPVFWLLKISGAGEYLYNELALKRNILPIHCDDNCSIR
ncbi:DCC1-like thiol-disulfide oxidoreductase family protein [Flavobacterium sp. ST-75]|uniref:DCC1-like thiol-disulfide oxidoreductase family protein n=1 Tax=Flavobacterium rhizophilum TaxID=3163296 RepID=A0ABW8YAB8_9FLAO